MELFEDQTKIRRVLRDTVALLCKNSLFYSSQLKIEGLLGITLDDRVAVLVPFNELINGTCDESILDQPSRSLSNIVSRKLNTVVDSGVARSLEHTSIKSRDVTVDLLLKTARDRSVMVSHDSNVRSDGPELCLSNSMVQMPSIKQEFISRNLAAESDRGDVRVREPSTETESVCRMSTSLDATSKQTVINSNATASPSFQTTALNEAKHNEELNGNWNKTNSSISARSSDGNDECLDVFQKAADEVYALSHCPEYSEPSVPHGQLDDCCASAASVGENDVLLNHFPRNHNRRLARRILEQCAREEGICTDFAQRLETKREKDRIRKRRQRLRERMRLSFLEAGLAIPPYLERRRCRFNPCDG